MPIEFRCDQCGKLLRTGDETAGKQAKCPSCGRVMPVPAVEAEDLSGEASGPFGPGGPYQAPRQGPEGSPISPPAGAPGYIPNYLVQAILCTVFCCLPFGIVAIVFAAQVNSHLAAGNFAAARDASANARLWCWVAFVLGLVVVAGWMMLVCAGGMVG